jgi:threonine dehydrogenase-like Zn-dependent dehydrogenase
VGFLTNLIAYSLTERRVSGREFLPERIERAEVFDGDRIVINVAYNTDEELRQDYINMLRGRGLTVEALDEELQSLRKAVLN